MFGARGTGKSTFLREQFSSALYFDLLNPELEDKYSLSPQSFKLDLLSQPKNEWVIIDEVQKAPKLLDLVHQFIFSSKQKFILSGSSARKLKRGAANLLAGRAHVQFMFPLTHLELSEQFDLVDVLQFGSLPEMLQYTSREEKRAYLKSYSQTYLQEEIRLEQVVRNLNPFRNFLAIAAHVSGKPLNLHKMSRQVGVDDKTIENYYSILEDTLVGFYLPHFHRSIRKSQTKHFKFYFFDLGVKNFLAETIDVEPKPATSHFGELFEYFLILEVFRYNSYSGKDYQLSFYLTKNGVEIDLILTKARKDILVEIKSSITIDEDEVKKLKGISTDFESHLADVYYVSQDPRSVELNGVKCRHWKDFITELFQ